MIAPRLFLLLSALILTAVLLLNERGELEFGAVMVAIGCLFLSVAISNSISSNRYRGRRRR